MGCDIHMYPEKKTEYGWQFVYRYIPNKNRPDVFPWKDRDNYFAWEDRWYWLFGQLAGVRRLGPPIAEPRGCPYDADSETKEAMEDLDYHTPSWLTLEELQAHPWEERHDGTVTPEQIKEVKDWLSRLSELGPPSMVRVVFAFDN